MQEYKQSQMDRRQDDGFKLNISNGLATLFHVLVLLFGMISYSVAAPELKGSWQPGAMIIGQAEPGAVIYFQNRRVALTSTGQFVFGLGRNASGVVQLKVETDGIEEIFDYTILPRKYDIQHIEGVPQRTVSPPEEALNRIRREAALVRHARADNDARVDFLHGFTKPLEGPITGVYGSQRIYNGVPKNPHYGLDIARPTGTLVQAPAAGLIKLVHDDMYYSGGTLIIDHGHGISSTFIHLSEILVAEGAYVNSGENVARVGASGRATGPHLDWRMNWFNVRLDPGLVLRHFSKELNAR